MTFLEALRIAHGTDLWVRPVSFKGLWGLTWDGDRVKSVPDRNGGRIAEIPHAPMLFEEWEAVTPGQVYKDAATSGWYEV